VPNNVELIHLADGEAISEVTDEYKVVAVRHGNKIDVSRVYPNRYVDETDPAFNVSQPCAQKRLSFGSYSISEYKELVASYGGLVGAF
jgi:hypothetical protein